jgi:hypothetical protein
MRLLSKGKKILSIRSAFQLLEGWLIMSSLTMDMSFLALGVRIL